MQVDNTRMSHSDGVRSHLNQEPPFCGDSGVSSFSTLEGNFSTPEPKDESGDCMVARALTRNISRLRTECNWRSEHQTRVPRGCSWLQVAAAVPQACLCPVFTMSNQAAAGKTASQAAQKSVYVICFVIPSSD